MREILFRGQLIGTKEWVYGTYHYSNDGKYHYILNRESFLERTYDLGNEMALKKPEIHFVDSKTIGQFIGQLDVNGVRIFEGDLIERKNTIRIEQVEWYEGHCSFETGEASCVLDNECGVDYQSLKVVGNIYDNPELAPSKSCT